MRVTSALLVVAVFGCKKLAPKADLVASVTPTAITPADATLADATLADVAPPQPSSQVIEFQLVNRDDDDTFRNYVTYPQFHTKPASIGKQLNAYFAPRAKSGVDSKTTEGDFDFRCEPLLVNSVAVDFECGRMLYARPVGATEEESDGGAPAGLTPTQFARWLEPGLPVITIDELAPGVNVDEIIAKHMKAAPSVCSACEIKRTSWQFSDDGIVFAHTEYCLDTCKETLPLLAYDQLKPKSARANALLEWIRQMHAANYGLVTGDTTP